MTSMAALSRHKGHRSTPVLLEKDRLRGALSGQRRALEEIASAPPLWPEAFTLPTGGDACKLLEVPEADVGYLEAPSHPERC